MFLHNRTKKQFLLVEPVAKTPYPPLGLMKISSMLKRSNVQADVFSQVGMDTPPEVVDPEVIYVTSLFTWDLKKVITTVKTLKKKFPGSDIKIGGIAASLLPDYVLEHTGISPTIGLLEEAEEQVPDYEMNFGRKLRTSISFTSRGCIRDCNFCTVKKLEPQFYVKTDWERDINLNLPQVTFWDNNWLASPNLYNDIDKLRCINKKIDFNQGLDARLYTEDVAIMLSELNIDPIRFAFDDITQEADVIRAIRIAKRYTRKEICIYVLYNFKDTPEEFYYKINILNNEKVLAFPMGYRAPVDIVRAVANKYWNQYLLRGLKLSLLFYYRRGMITESRASFVKIYGNSPAEFVSNLYRIYDYDKALKRSPSGGGNV